MVIFVGFLQTYVPDVYPLTTISALPSLVASGLMAHPLTLFPLMVILLILIPEATLSTVSCARIPNCVPTAPQDTLRLVTDELLNPFRCMAAVLGPKSTGLPPTLVVAPWQLLCIVAFPFP